ncbi:MAG: hypothetical protein ACLP01_11550 [Solirubrobacteraceae bacterium]
MIERDEATAFLTRLAAPTLAAFTEARIHYTAQRKSLDTIRKRMAWPVAAVLDGISYWAPFATFLTEHYEAVAGVDRVAGTHPLAHRWTIDGRIVVQLKSDTGNLPLEQLVLPGMRNAPGGPLEQIVLTWDHDHIQRFDPAFVRLDGRREAWRIPVASLAEPEAEAIAPTAAKSTVSSARRLAEEDGRSDQSS